MWEDGFMTFLRGILSLSVCVFVYLSLTFLHRCVNVKCTLVQELRLCTGRTPHRGSRGIAVLYR
jgi:hypothetical protein